MKPDQKIFFLIVFIAFAFFISGCKSPVGPIAFPESFGPAIEDTLQQAVAPVAADTAVAPTEADTVAAPTRNKSLTLIVKNLASPKAPVFVAFYGSKNKFLSKTDRLKAFKFKPDGNTLTVQIKNLGYGEFAIATYQDVNSDGKINRSMIGIPKEPYGFSNDIKPTLKAPSFVQCKFTFSEDASTQTINMIR